ncbi:MAG: SWIM zinc finger family protein [Alteromonadaceae bacterium]|nr:SWIM zinc finger family protein [Alteromonadaceae bacterium]
MSSKLIHKTWWGKEFVSALEAYIDPGRLQRGKSYRTDNRILEFAIDGSEIKATIRGNINPYFGVTKEPRYKVVLKFDQISPTKWQAIIKTLCGNALWLSKLMLNEIPNSIEDAFGSERLLPSSYKDVKTSCSCPDYSEPCKHIAGVYYRIASILDSNPMLLFQLRGISPEKLHQELKKTELGQAFSDHLTLPESVEMVYQQHKYTPIHVKREKVGLTKQTVNASRFWSMPASVQLVNTGVDESMEENVNKKTGKSVLHKNVSVKYEVEAELRSESAPIGTWPSNHQSSDNITEISAALIKKQGDYPEFWTKSNSFINAMELFYSHTRKKNQKDLF